MSLFAFGFSNFKRKRDNTDEVVKMKIQLSVRTFLHRAEMIPHLFPLVKLAQALYQTRHWNNVVMPLPFLQRQLAMTLAMLCSNKV
ncbi:hypothetical protein HOLleu_22454 [Holothuria leucospilota]|uniref:Uncharacterized protein n=1 Tax=Holothuria leucospilota TaxID=206669 RepID=A0A9Q1H7I8_HOLLE|nr:hypothetical protein HOLleu_22454 [Holothuria leucospilota]